ncbi:MAG: cohesin domain-containing protein, partial [Candidatus Polarisedimenticolia bacterium]
GGGAPSRARLRVASGTAATGGSLRVAIMAEGAEPAVAMDLSLAFDPAILRPIAADRGEAAAAFTLTTNTTVPGRIRLGLYGVRPLGGSGEIAVITFQVTGPAGGATDLILDASLDEGRLAAEVRDGRVRVRPGR